MKIDLKTGRPWHGERRGIALIMVMLIISTLMIIGILFSGSVTAEYRASVYYRQAVQSEQYCIAGLHRAMAELMYDVWGVNEDRPFVSARYNPSATGPDDNLLAMADSPGLAALDRAAYFEVDPADATSVTPIVRQKGFWNGQAWVVWGGTELPTVFPASGDPQVDGNVWNMDPRAMTRQEILGGAQRYMSYGQGTVAVTSGSAAVTGTGTSFDTTWPSGTNIWIERLGVLAINGTPGSATTLNLNTNSTITATGLSWGIANTAGLGGVGAALSGGPQSINAFVGANVGYAANPRWVNPEAFISYSINGAGNFSYGGVDLNGDGLIDQTDKNLRSWALWKLKCDAFLPEAMDNNDAFEGQLHANNRLRWGLKYGTKDAGFECLSPFIVGDSFYQVFRSDPIYTMFTSISGQAGSQDALATLSDTAGYRYPYDRTHVGKDTAVALANDPVGGLANINQVNNNYNTEEWTSTPSGGATPDALTWYHINESKWIYCYDPLNDRRRFGRYAVTVMPDCSTWNAAALHSGQPDIYNPNYSYLVTGSTGAVEAASGMMVAIQSGFNPQSGASAGAALLQSVDVCFAPIRPNPLPSNWCNTGTDSGGVYWCADGTPDVGGTVSYSIKCDRTRSPEIRGGHSGGAWGSFGARSAIFNYLLWLGPYDSRAELATHLRKACLVIPSPAYEPYGEPYNLHHCGNIPPLRRCMETEMNVNASALAKVARDAQLIAALTTVHGYYYTLDRFWDRNLLMIDWEKGTTGSATDYRLATLQSTAASPVADPAAAGAMPHQKTRNRLMRDLNGLECFGGYRTRDGKYRLLDYLFAGDDAPADYLTFLASDSTHSFTPGGFSKSPVYGGAVGTIDNPSSWNIQRRTSRREKFMATTISRIASANRNAGWTAGTASCASGHLLYTPKLSSWNKPVWSGTAKSETRRTAAADPTDDEIGAGCPVCGGKLFLAQPYDYGINEIGRFYGKFRNAERPARNAWDLSDPTGAKKPARHFVELLNAGRGIGYGGDPWVRFDSFSLRNSDGSDAMSDRPGVLADPITNKPYYSHDLEFDWRFRRRTDDAEGRDPEPIFRGMPARGGGGHTSSPDVDLLVYDESDQGGRWHSVTWYMDNKYGMKCGYGSEHTDFRDLDAQLYSYTVCVDDTNPDSALWTAKVLACDERYAMEDPDPAHRQTSAAAGTPFPPTAHSGTKAHVSTVASGVHQHYYYDDPAPVAVPVGATFYAWIYLDPSNPPSAVMLQFRDAGNNWTHRAYWGANLFTNGTDGTNSRRPKGALPATGSWVQLTCTAAEVGMEGQTLEGIAFTLYDGRAAWDDAGVNGVARVDEAYPAGATPNTVSGSDYAWSWVTPLGAGVMAPSRAYVSNYRKMPVRWAGGARKESWNLDYNWDWKNWDQANPEPSSVRSQRGLGFRTMTLWNNRDRAGNFTVSWDQYHDYLYAGDAVWPSAAIAMVSGDRNTKVFSGRTQQNDWPGCLYRHSNQYGVMNFDASFDGSRVALLWGDRLISYVELTDSAGNPQRISATCVADATEPTKMRSWQARNPKDTRGNADGYMCWDLLPLTLPGTIDAGNAPTLDSVGYDPWWINETVVVDGTSYAINYGAGCGWWGAGGPYNANRAAGQSLPAGYADLSAGVGYLPMARNSNMWNLHYPGPRGNFDGTVLGSKHSSRSAFESLVRTMWDHSNYYDSYHTYNIKECTMSTPTGIGRQVSDVEASDPTKGTYSGRQYTLAGTWHDGVNGGGAGTVDPRSKWAGYSWNSWADIYDVTDLCQKLMWDIYGNTVESVDLFDENENGLRDERSTSTTTYSWSNGGVYTPVTAISGSFLGELRQINKLNLNEMWFPPTFSGVGWNQSYISFGRKPLKGFHSPSAAMDRHFWTQPSYGAPTYPGYNLCIRPWDLDSDSSLEPTQTSPPGHIYRYDSTHCSNSPVYTIFVTGSAVDDQGEALAEMRLRATVERTWDGRCNILEFCWLPTDRSFLE
ncbi:MAG TPA: hypothetical protein PK280_09875 [Planctomycetota bacterium]|nr:hypothetical protein [Planctomycetota bacterium]